MSNINQNIQINHAFTYLPQFLVFTSRERICVSLRHRRSEGQLTGLAPIGYKNIRDEKNNPDVVVNTKQANIIIKLFKEYATGKYSIKQITNLANSLGLVNRYGKPVSESGINKMLKNPFYYGEMLIKGTFIPHKYQKLIDKSLFDDVQTVMKSHK